MEYVIKAGNCLGMLLVLLALLSASKYYLHFLQLESYYLAGYKNYMFKKLYLFVAFALPGLLGLIPFKYMAIIVLPLQALAVYLLGKRLFSLSNQKKPLVVTGRVKRLLAIEAILLLGVAVGMAFGFAVDQRTALFGLLPALLPFIIALATLLAMPIEYGIRRWYMQDAKKKLAARSDLKIIGITGSYGKTSTKFLLSTILSEKYSVLTPPSSYNTTLGVVRVIRERLQPDDQVFICEMGSRHIGDIREICNFVTPEIGIITSIGPQHLETFGSIENVVKGKFELVEAVKGAAFFPAGNQYTEQMYDMAKCEKHLFGVDTQAYMYASNLTVGPDGSCFALVNEKGENVFCTTALLGRHNVQNIVACAAVAYYMGLSMEQIARGIAKLQPVEHRLQIVSRRPMTVIDDAFNASPNGAKAALAVLASFPGRRIIVTPGFVELGPKQEQYHYELGTQIATSADIAVLVGERTKQVRKGLLEAGFSQDAIKTVASLAEATEVLKAMGKAGDTVLFENDLPDHY